MIWYLIPGIPLPLFVAYLPIVAFLSCKDHSEMIRSLAQYSRFHHKFTERRGTMWTASLLTQTYNYLSTQLVEVANTTVALGLGTEVDKSRPPCSPILHRYKNNLESMEKSRKKQLHHNYLITLLARRLNCLTLYNFIQRTVYKGAIITDETTQFERYSWQQISWRPLAWA